MKAITLWPEWAACVLYAGKRVENRTWRPPEKLIGQRLALHAGAYIGGRPGGYYDAHAAVMGTAARVQRFLRLRRSRVLEEVAPDGRLLGQHVVATRAVVATFELGKPWRATGKGWESDDPDTWCWPLLDVRVLPDPVPAVGSQGLWTLPDDVATRVGR